jgi:RimJ/RimL family protein N-acetyltransferase
MSDLSFAVPGREHAALLLGWRSLPRVTRFMFTDVLHGQAEQEAWLDGVRSRADYRHWLVLQGGRPIGLVNLHAIDPARQSAASGFYIGEESARPLGGFVLPYLYNHGFFDLGFLTMTAQVMAENVEVLRLHRLHGYRDEGPQPEGVVKNGTRHAVHRLTLSREAWAEQPRLHRYRAAFPWP